MYECVSANSQRSYNRVRACFCLAKFWLTAANPISDGRRDHYSISKLEAQFSTVMSRNVVDFSVLAGPLNDPSLPARKMAAFVTRRESVWAGRIVTFDNRKSFVTQVGKQSCLVRTNRVLLLDSFVKVRSRAKRLGQIPRYWRVGLRTCRDQQHAKDRKSHLPAHSAKHTATLEWLLRGEQ
jgi:hypothetical protein